MYRLRALVNWVLILLAVLLRRLGWLRLLMKMKLSVSMKLGEFVWVLLVIRKDRCFGVWLGVCTVVMVMLLSWIL